MELVLAMIFISAGHYPSSPGAKWQRFVEHDEAEAWADLLDAALDDSMRVPSGVVRSKIDFINSRIMPGDVAVEIHFNAARDKKGNNVGEGSETLYFPNNDESKALAELCQTALAKIFQPDRGIKEGWYRADPSRGADFFLAQTECPSVILHPEFVHRAGLIWRHRIDAINALAAVLNTLTQTQRKLIRV